MKPDNFELKIVAVRELSSFLCSGYVLTRKFIVSLLELKFMINFLCCDAYCYCRHFALVAGGNFIEGSFYYDLKFDLPVTKSISEFRYFLLVEVYAHIFALNLTCVLISPRIRGVIYLGETSLVKKKKMRERMIFFFNFSHPFFSFPFLFPLSLLADFMFFFFLHFLNLFFFSFSFLLPSRLC